MKQIWGYLRHYKRIIAGALALAAVNQIFSLADPQLFRLIVDRYASRVTDIPQADFLRGVGVLILGMVGVAFVSRVAKNFQDYLVSVVEQRLGARLYETSVAHSFSLSFSVFEDQRSGELLGKLQKARTDTQALVRNFVSVVFFSAVGVVFVLTYSFMVHWLIGGIYALMIPTLAVVTMVISRRIKAAQGTIVRESTALAGSTTETLRNVELVKSLGLEAQEVERLNSVNERILKLELRKIRLVRTLAFIQGTLINALRSALLLLMFWMIFRESITLGEFLTLYFYSFFIFSPLAEFGLVAQNYQETRASLEQLEAIKQQPPEPTPANPKPVGTLKTITFDDVSFKYQSAVHPSLTDLSFTIGAGETVAFVGPSGSGKTTIIKLLAGLYRPTSGTIRYNDVDVSDVDFTQFRRRIGLVAQETQLFAGTIRENLRFVRPEATDEECRAVLGAAQATSILERAAEGLDTKIGEGGIKVSGGERQRLAIARALLRQPDLLIFDEATSSLDSMTEGAITQTIEHIEESRPELTTVLIAHRLSTIAHADRIVVLERGRVVETGRHDELLTKQGLYTALWREQQAAGNGIGPASETIVVPGAV